MAYDKAFETKPGLIGLQEAADYLNCSHQTLSKILKAGKNPLCSYFRFYAGSYRTTKPLLDAFFTSEANQKGDIYNEEDAQRGQ